MILTWFLFWAGLAAAKTAPIELHPVLKAPLRFVAYGDTRFTDPADHEAANPEVRRALVKGIAKARPAFISIGGDIAYNGSSQEDWRVFDDETEVWRQRKIPVFPVLGNHDLKGDLATCLANYFQRFPAIEGNRYYSVRTANILLLNLDSSLDEVSGPQGDWLLSQLDHIDAGTDFVVMAMHHPPVTSSTDAKRFGGGHSARSSEQALGELLESRQAKMRAAIVVFSGHVHNYERHQHGGVTYFVTGGGGAHAYPIERAPGDPFPDQKINYHYLLAKVDHNRMTVSMHRLEIVNGKQIWTVPDTVEITKPRAGRM